MARYMLKTLFLLVLILPQALFASEIDLSSWTAESSISLDGPWDFYWKKLRTPESPPETPDFRMEKISDWQDLPLEGITRFGYATYEVVLRNLPKGVKNYTFVLDGYSGQVRVYLVSEKTKKILNLFDRSDFKKKVIQKNGVNLHFYLEEAESIRVIIQASNEVLAWSGIWRAPTLAPTSFANKSYYTENIMNLLSAGVALAVGFYSLLIFIRRRQDEVSLYLFLLSLSVFLRTISTTDVFSQISLSESYHTILKIVDYASIPALAVSACLFVKQAFFLESYRWLARLIVGSSSLLILSTIFLPPVVYTSYLQLYQFQSALTGIAIIWVLMHAVISKKEGALLILFGMACAVSAAIFDIVVVNILKLFPTQIMPIGSAAFLFIQSQLVARRSAAAYERSELYAAELVEKENARTLFFHNTSHELRTPLNGIIGYLELMNQGSYGELSAAMRQQITKVLKLVDSLKYQVNTILDLAKSNKGDLKANYQQIDTKELFEEASALAEGLKLKSSGLSFTARFEGEKHFIGDKEKISTIIRNLVGNAFKFKDPERDNHVSLSLSCDKETLIIKVEDTGIGIAADQQSRIFEEFAQVEGDARRRYEGTGLGLSMVKRLVELMGGEIKLNSEPSKGSSFEVVLKAKEVTTEFVESKAKKLDIEISKSEVLIETLPTKHKPRMDASWRVLIIDDNETNCEVIEQMLALDGYTLKASLSGREGLEEMKEFKPHLVVLDMMMPEMSGEDVIKAMSLDETLKNIPVILVTARASQEDRLYGLSLGANDYLPKPIVADELRLRVFKTLDRERIFKELLDSYLRLENEEKKSSLLASEVSQVNRQLIQAEKMVLLGQLVASVAHDMASPTQLISLSSKDLELVNARNLERIMSLIGDSTDEAALLVKEEFNKDFKTHSELLESIKIANKRIAGIQSAIRNQSRTKDGFEAFPILEVIDECVIILGSKLKPWKLVVEASRDILVKAYRGEVGQLITNLLSNACDALKGHKSSDIDILIVVEVKTSESIGSYVQIIIEDNGPGISPLQREKVFEAFYTSKPLGEGTGLGLSICKKVAQSNQGSIRIIDSTRLKGACFELRLLGGR